MVNNVNIGRYTIFIDAMGMIRLMDGWCFLVDGTSNFLKNRATFQRFHPMLCFSPGWTQIHTRDPSPVREEHLRWLKAIAPLHTVRQNWQWLLHHTTDTLILEGVVDQPMAPAYNPPKTLTKTDTWGVRFGYIGSLKHCTKKKGRP